MERVPPGLLQHGRVVFKPLRYENVYTHFRWNNDPALNRLDSEQPFAYEPFGAFRRRFEALVFRPDPACRDFEVHTVEGHLIGLAYLYDLDWHCCRATVGITIGERSYWGHGYGREALQLMLRHAFDDLGLHRITAQTFSYNAPWRRLLIWAGFLHEGTERDSIRRDEQFWDKENYALLAHEYAAWSAHRLAA